MAKMLVFPYNLFCLLKFCFFGDDFRLVFFHFTSIFMAMSMAVVIRVLIMMACVWQKCNNKARLQGIDIHLHYTPHHIYRRLELKARLKNLIRRKPLKAGSCCFKSHYKAIIGHFPVRSNDRLANLYIITFFRLTKMVSRDRIWQDKQMLFRSFVFK